MQMLRYIYQTNTTRQRWKCKWNAGGNACGNINENGKVDGKINKNGSGGSEQNPKYFHNLKYKASLALWPS